MADIAENIMRHPDKEEILAKIIAGNPPDDIAEWLKYKYVEVGEKRFVISSKDIKEFKKNNLNMYLIMKEDLETMRNNNSSESNIKTEIQGTPGYHAALEKYAEKEVDVKSIIKKLVLNAELRLSQMFDIIQEDPQNFRVDRNLVEWFNTLTAILEKYDTILNGSPGQVNIQNNINIQIVDQQINIVYNIIKEILEKLDYDKSLLFIDMFNERMKLVKTEDGSSVPVEDRIAAANILSEKITAKF